METKKAYIEDINKDSKFLDEAAKIIKDGGVVAFPTETVYGLGANALDPEAVIKIFKAKGRPQDNPLIVHVASKDISEYVEEIPELAVKLMDKFWPGPLTMILKKKSIIPATTSANLDSIGIRMPDSEIALELIKRSGKPIAAPSANISGRPSPTDMERCIEDLDGKIDYILGGERSEVGVESTIVDLTVNPPCILRPGGLTLEDLREVDEKIYIDKALLEEKVSNNLKPKAPGMKYTHYSPKAKVRIIRGEQEKVLEKIGEMLHNYKDEDLKVGIMATDETKDFYKDTFVISLGKRSKPETIAKSLFEALRSFDDAGVDIILSESFEEKGIGIAIMNRLKKSSGFDIIDV
ncbi:L-threonylcarbamoyladenylate synthase [Clostridium mediterraneense]|uniref:L-threonylcarbamoyladenylate synthase n=1 Tax=Clostridium mediterraneense TaxID=1805472 RepID=UPI00083023E6|nr:L-threonylcarbamoyladenylate synthase [Clostridium mediterraneense]